MQKDLDPACRGWTPDQIPKYHPTGGLGDSKRDERRPFVLPGGLSPTPGEPVPADSNAGKHRTAWRVSLEDHA